MIQEFQESVLKLVSPKVTHLQIAHYTISPVNTLMSLVWLMVRLHFVDRFSPGIKRYGKKKSNSIWQRRCYSLSTFGVFTECSVNRYVKETTLMISSAKFDNELIIWIRWRRETSKASWIAALEDWTIMQKQKKNKFKRLRTIFAFSWRKLKLLFDFFFH